MYSSLVELGIPKALLHRLHAFPEQVQVELLKARPGDAAVEVHALKQSINLDARLGA